MPSFTRRLQPILLVVAAIIAPPPANARGAVELSFNPVLTSRSVAGIDAELSGRTLLAPTFRLGYRALESLDVYVGYRFASEDLPGAQGASGGFSTDSYLAGFRLRKAIVGGWLSLYGQIDIEAVHAKIDGTAGGDISAKLVADDWVLGVVPEAGLEAAFQDEGGLGLVVRVGVGYAERGSATLVGGVKAGGQFVPVGIAGVDLSGLAAGATLGLLF